ncbi:MAG: UDP-N-acetylmuramate dehydrogenase [bacterium]
MNDIAEKIGRLAKSLQNSEFKGRISFDFPLSSLTTYRIGGPASIMAEIGSVDDLILFLKSARDESVPTLILGAGSNVLFSDEGYRGAVIRLEGLFRNLAIENNKVYAGSGLILAKLVSECALMGLAGIERLAGIPGTIGGAIVMNAGTFGEYMDSLLVSVDILSENLDRKTLSPGECSFGYRSSRFADSGEIILGCTMKFEPGDPSEISGEIARRRNRRQKTQPVNMPSCGCVFRNPSPDNPAAKLIEDAGLKGMSHGGAVISGLHANYIVNENNASAKDVLYLMAEARKIVREKTGITLRSEVRLYGFENNPEEMLDAREKE